MSAFEWCNSCETRTHCLTQRMCATARLGPSPQPESAAKPCLTCNDDPAVCATVPGLRHCEKAMRNWASEEPAAPSVLGSAKPSISGPSEKQGPYRTSDAEDGEDVLVLDGSGEALTADEIVVLLNNAAPQPAATGDTGPRSPSANVSAVAAPGSAIPQSMSSAPTDGTPVLGFVPTYYQGKGAWVVVLWLHGKWMDNRAWATDPSCWLPLPSSPLDGTASKVQP